MTPAYRQRIATLHRELGIPETYAEIRRLPLCDEADVAGLVEVARTDDDRPVQLVAPAAEAWRAMRSAAAGSGVTLLPLSGFRSVTRQTELIRGKLAAAMSIDDVLRYVAAPGHSEHHTGRALDLGSPEHLALEEEFANTLAFRWLRDQAGSFGFRLSYPPGNPHQIGFEPWHWCWHPSGL